MEIIYDGHNWLRRRLERGADMRLCMAELRTHPGTIVFDGWGAKKRRKDLYPEYKARRNVASDDFFKQLEYFEGLCRFAPVAKVRVPGWEADDVIATFVRREPGNYFIKSSDVDFLQLPGVQIDRDTAVTIPPRWMRLYKTIVGDTSDNVKGIKGFGKKGWTGLLETSKEDLERFCSGESDFYYKDALSKVSQTWLEDPVNLALVRTYWHIVGLWDVPWEDIIKHTTIGTDDFDGLDNELRRYYN